MTISGHHPCGERCLYAETHGAGQPFIVVETSSTMAGTSDPGWQLFIPDQRPGLVMDVIQRLACMQGRE